MMVTPGELLDTSIAQLQTLAAFLADQLSDQGAADRESPAAEEARACREVMASLGALIHRLRAARTAIPAAAHPDSLHTRVARPGPASRAYRLRADGPHNRDSEGL
jgi:hypothetical protein